MKHDNGLLWSILRALYFSKDEKLHVYDYMAAGSLPSLLHGMLSHLNSFYLFGLLIAWFCLVNLLILIFRICFMSKVLLLIFLFLFSYIIFFLCLFYFLSSFSCLCVSIFFIIFLCSLFLSTFLLSYGIHLQSIQVGTKVELVFLYICQE